MKTIVAKKISDSKEEVPYEDLQKVVSALDAIWTYIRTKYKGSPLVKELNAIISTQSGKVRNLDPKILGAVGFICRGEW